MFSKINQHSKLVSLFISILVFSIMYLFLDDKHFNGVNYIKDTIKKEVIKKKIDKEIEEEPTDIEGFSSLIYSDPKLLKTTNVEQKLNETTKDVKQDVKQKELTPEKIETPIFQKLYDRLYFSIVTGTLLGYGDIYPTTNISKFMSMCQSLFTVSLIVY